MNIVLIGMPGVGKSTIGVLLAKTLGLTFVDTDLVIQQREGTLLQQIINNRGLEAFLATEEEAILNLQGDSMVIATGGSVVYKDISMKHLREMGKIVYLHQPYRVIKKRIRNISTRGIAMGANQSLRDVYLERTILYEKYADLKIDCKGKSVEQTIGELASWFKAL